jgi:Subtilase family/Fibronectin type-III domain/Peptidase inhibitor I9/PA domain
MFLSDFKHRAGRSWLLALAAAVVGVTFITSAAARSDEGADKSEKATTATYIVGLLEPPTVAYDGGVAGLAATKPAKGQKIDPNSAHVRKYVDYLDGRHAAALQKVGGGQKLRDYRYAFNGFAARLTPEQVERLKADPAVLSVEKTREVTMDTATTPEFLGLKDPANGLWTAPRNIKGENVIIGILDSGVWPESKSFTDRDARGKLVYRQIPGFHGKCASAETAEPPWDANLCNKKLVSAQFFCEVRGCDTVLEHEFLSPRDYNGHGSHTASTAGGNEGVPTTGAAAILGTVNGIAPRARIAVYKVCWDNGAGGCGSNSGDAVAAIDQAVADGVDVINYSISGTQTNYLDAVEVAYLFAADAGVFVATSAGNSGPTASTVAHISPWLAAVAAGTHNRTGNGSVTVGGTKYDGRSIAANAVTGPAVLATAVGKADGDDPATSINEIELCFVGALDPAKAAGKIVVCDRGTNARTDKSFAVQEAGGIGMVLVNPSLNSVNADLHHVPSVHLDHVAGAAVKTYVGANPGASATIAKGVVVTDNPAPTTAVFSSRGPSRAGGGDILKPDFMLPGEDILASVAPPGNKGRLFDMYSGTSMSSPHVAGAAALLTQAHPDWSPAAMRSAMATTADPAVAVGTATPFDNGSGHVRPNLMVNPGLVYDAGFADYLSFLKGQRLITNNVPAIDASDLNQPSIAIGDLAGVQTVTRRVRNVGGASATYSASVVAPAGFTASVDPTSFTIAAGATQQFTVTFTRTDAPLNAYRFGSLTWSDGSHNVRSPLVVRPVALSAPAELSGTGASGSTTYTIKTGYEGPLAYAKRGLIASTPFSGTVPDDPTDDFDTGNPAGNQGIVTHDIVVPANSTFLRISMFDAETDGADDIDLYLYRVNADGSLTLVGLSGGGTSAEQIQITPPAAGATYRLFVHGWQTDGPDANYTLHTWALGTADAGNMTVTGPTTAGIGTTSPVELSWTGLEPGKRYIGQIRYQQGTTLHGTTIVRIDT